MADDRVVMMSVQGYKTLASPEKGKGLHWATDVHSELPIKMRSQGPGSERPITIPKLFLNCVKENGSRNSMFVERDGKIFVWTWDQYNQESLKFAKSLSKLNVKERSAVAIMGYNCPEWAIGFTGA